MQPLDIATSPNLENLANQINYQPNKFNVQVIWEEAGQKALLFAFAAGQELKTHTTPHPALLTVLEGSCLFHMHGNSQMLQAGAVIIIPANIPHALTAQSNFKMLLLK